MATKGKAPSGAKSTKYKENQTREKNKVKFLEKYLKKNPNDNAAKARVEEIKAIIKINKV